MAEDSAPDLPRDAPVNRSAGCGVTAFAVLLLLVAAGVTWAWLRNPPDRPAPSGTANPPTVPGGEAPS